VVAISGSNFAGLSSVTFAGTPSNAITTSGTGTIYATVPKNAPGLAAIIVSTSAGPSSPGPGSWYYYNPGTDRTASVSYDGTRQTGTIALILAATSSITASTWQLNDPLIVGALCTAASNGIQVQLVEDLNNRSGGEPSYAGQIVASGGTVTNAPVPRWIANNFMVVDGGTTTTGNYYWSPTAVQAGNYCSTIVGTNNAAACQTEYSALVIGGTNFVSLLERHEKSPPTQFVKKRAGGLNGATTWIISRKQTNRKPESHSGGSRHGPKSGKITPSARGQNRFCRSTQRRKTSYSHPLPANGGGASTVPGKKSGSSRS
jgi:hypothetical protein